MIQQLEKWTFEQSHCKIGFSVRHFGISQTEGAFKKFEGSITSEKEDFSDAQVDLIMDANSIDTQDQARDGHLKSADFFNAEQFPVIHFQSTKMEVIKDNLYKMTGDLTMVGITKPVV